MALFSEGSCYTCSKLCHLVNWSGWHQLSASFLHSCQQVKSNTQTVPHSRQPLSKDTWFLLSNHTSNTSAALNASIKTGRREHLLNVNYVPGLGMLMPYLSHHLTASHLISPSIHSFEWKKRFKMVNQWCWWSPMAVITWEASLSAYPLIQQFHF